MCKYAMQDRGLIKSGAEAYKSGCAAEDQHGFEKALERKEFGKCNSEIPREAIGETE